jgi:predicted amidophosphoribosyltransferase
MKRPILYILGAGALVIGATVWLTYPSSTSSFISDPSKYQFMYCPHCDKEEKFDLDKFANGCKKCGSEFVPTEKSIAATGRPPSPYVRMFMLIFAELLVTMAAVWFIGRPRSRDPEEDYLYINCVKCKQRIRYRVEQVGQMAMCRRCKRPFRYPEPAPEDA